MFKKKVNVPSWKDVSIAMSMSTTMSEKLGVLKKIFWNLVNILCNARSLWRAVKLMFNKGVMYA